MQRQHQPLDERLRLLMVDLAVDEGLLAAAKIIGVSRQTYAVIAAGIPVSRAIVIGVRARLAELASPETWER